MLFLDGVGIGRRDGLVNPFFAARLPILRGLLSGGVSAMDSPQRKPAPRPWCTRTLRQVTESAGCLVVAGLAM
jgi:hypothetical protein